MKRLAKSLRLVRECELFKKVAQLSTIVHHPKSILENIKVKYGDVIGLSISKVPKLTPQNIAIETIRKFEIVVDCVVICTDTRGCLNEKTLGLAVVCELMGWEWC